jgi:hypothetical protein
MYGLRSDQIFVIKCLMKKQPFQFVFLALAIGVIGFGYAIRVAEAPLSRVDNFMDHSDFSKCCWEAIVTMTTGMFFFRP